MTGVRDKVKIGIIGAGHLGKYHIECAQRIEGFSLEGIYDIDDNRAEKISSQYGVRVFKDFEEMLDYVDAVCVVTPTSTHHSIGLKALDAGKHLFIEKPLTDNPTTSKKLAALVLELTLVGRIVHVERYNPSYIAAKKFELNQPVF